MLDANYALQNSKITLETTLDSGGYSPIRKKNFPPSFFPIYGRRLTTRSGGSYM